MANTSNPEIYKVYIGGIRNSSPSAITKWFLQFKIKPLIGISTEPLTNAPRGFAFAFFTGKEVFMQVTSGTYYWDVGIKIKGNGS